MQIGSVGSVPTGALQPRRSRGGPDPADGGVSRGGHTTLDATAKKKESPFDRYAGRIKALVPFLTKKDKQMLGGLYAMTEQKYGADSKQMEKVDELARTLALQHMQEKANKQLAEEQQKHRAEELAESQRAQRQRAAEKAGTAPVPDPDRAAAGDPVGDEVTTTGTTVDVKV